jgi:hypothetical protein
MTDQNLVEVYRAENAPQAYLIRDQLEASGITARVDGDYLQGALGGLAIGWTSSPRVLVSEVQAAAAREVLAALER